MRTFEDVFRENMIRIQDVEDLTDKDFEKLGVTAIGLQLRVKQACRNQRQEMMFWSKEPVACYNGIRKETIESRNPKIHLKLILISFWLFGLERTQIPPLGFHKKLEIKFVEDPALLPVAHTCDLSLELSRGETPEEFHRKMELDITCGGEFHLA
ncbi:uncharacterized protein LOC111121232 isoform X2 [Crassostrea virginica]